MTKKNDSPTETPSGRGFTLIELMVVVLIIGVFAAIAAMQLVDVSRRNKLTDMANMVQQSAGMVRTYAMQTRHATVLEVGGGKVWINVLDGPTCWSALKAEDRCMHNMGKEATEARTNRFDLLDPDYVEAGAAMCGVEMWHLSGEGACVATGAMNVNSAFALCYSGEGDLFVRKVEDDTGCEGPALALPGQDILGQDSWSRACLFRGNTAGNSGAVMRFNRFDGVAGECTADNTLDVTRAVLVPVGAAPYGKVDL